MCEGAVWDALDKLGFISGLIVNVQRSGCFRFVCSYILTSGIGSEWSSGSQTSITSC